MNVAFDFISDLNIKDQDQFDWTDKPTSLYCIVAGNISDTLPVISMCLGHLSKLYQGVFYIPGYLEYSKSTNYTKTTNDLARVLKKFKNVALLDHHVVIINGVAILGCNGWHNQNKEDELTEIKITEYRYDDVIYLKNSVEKLQKHLDIKKIIIVSNAVPLNYLYYGESPKHLADTAELSLALVNDSETKVCTWIFGTYGKMVETTIDNVKYVNNTFVQQPYWPKRVDIEI